MLSKKVGLALVSASLMMSSAPLLAQSPATTRTVQTIPGGSSNAQAAGVSQDQARRGFRPTPLAILASLTGLAGLIILFSSGNKGNNNGGSAPVSP